MDSFLNIYILLRFSYMREENFRVVIWLWTRKVVLIQCPIKTIKMLELIDSDTVSISPFHVQHEKADCAWSILPVAQRMHIYKQHFSCKRAIPKPFFTFDHSFESSLRDDSNEWINVSFTNTWNASYTWISNIKIPYA